MNVSWRWMGSPGRILGSGLLLAVIAAAGLLEGRADGQEVGVLLLRNGQTLEGRVQATEDDLLVFVPGGLIRVKRFEVLACCRDLAEVYRYKLNLIRLDSAQDRLTLAQWCHQVGLLEEAHRELEAATALDPTHPLIPVLKRQLRTSPLLAQGEPANSQVAPGPSTYELDLMVRGMPPGTVETFAQTIQPLLVNRCGAASCHGQASPSRFRLFRMPPGGPSSRRLTQRNLYAALQWVDRAHPERSPLLTTPMRPHGTARAPVFGDHQLAQYRQLVDWCHRVAQAEPPVTQASYEQPTDDARPAFRRSANPHRSGHPTRANANSEVLSAVAIDPASGKEGQAAHPLAGKPKGERRPASVPKFVPTDPFDPEVFNRQFWSNSQPAASDGTKGGDRASPPKPAENSTASRPPSGLPRRATGDEKTGAADPPLPAAPIGP